MASISKIQLLFIIITPGGSSDDIRLLQALLICLLSALYMSLSSLMMSAVVCLSVCCLSMSVCMSVCCLSDCL